MKLTCLGSWGAYPAAGSANSAFLVEEHDFRLLIDCGSGVLSQLQQVISIEQLDALLLSHYHHDHIADIGCLQYAMMIQSLLGKRNKTLPIYAHGEGDNLFHTLTYKEFTTGHRIFAQQSAQIGPWKIEFCPTIHPAYCLAIKIISSSVILVITADTGWSESLASFCQGADVLICESSLYKEQKGLVQGHLTSEEAGLLAKRAGVEQLILTHLPHYGDPTQLVREAQEVYAGSVELAREQMQWKW